MAAFYCDTIEQFLNKNTDDLVGILSQKYAEKGYTDLKTKQIDSWKSLIGFLHHVFSQTYYGYEIRTGAILLEYEIPRRAKRIDCVLIIANKLIVIEFKDGESEYLNEYRKQLFHYCWDLVEFHLESRGLLISPILLCSKAEKTNVHECENNFINAIVCCGYISFNDALLKILNEEKNLNSSIDFTKWNFSNYKPTPTIIEAATSLFSNQGVEQILQNQAGKENLTKTCTRLLEIIDLSKTKKRKSICFVTGVPGAGKTLAGLKIVHDKELYDNESLGVFISGNGPLITVLKEALSQDDSNRNDSNIGVSRTHVSTFIMNVRDFITPKNERLNKEVDKIIVFDEAQRAWTRKKKESKSGGKYKASEPELILSIMDEHDDWAVIVALVGSGQEIHDGEAGLPEWGRALSEKFSNWEVYISPELRDGQSTVDALKLFEVTPKNIKVHDDEKYLHLKVNIRTPKATALAEWILFTLSNNPLSAKELYQKSLERFPLFITRDLTKAKNWLTNVSGIDSRYGIIGSSGGKRLKAVGLDVKSRVEVEKWFLKDRRDVRSSYCLENIATEFDVQGLELDWTLLCWDADLRRKNGNWEFKNFEGTRWKKVNLELDRNYILNKYRVLLSRAREGMTIFVPDGSESDETRFPEYYDPIFQYLKDCGVQEL